MFRTLRQKLHVSSLLTIVASTIVAGVLLSAAKVRQTVAASDCGTDTYFSWGCNGNGLNGLLWTIFNGVSAGVGLAVIGGIVYGAILYTTAAGNASQAQKAIGVIRNCVIALILYGAMWAILNWLVPGGSFK